MMKFEKVYDIYSKRNPATKSDDHRIDKVRDKFSEIIGNFGLEIKYFKPRFDNEGKVRCGEERDAFLIPESQLDFVLFLLENHTCADFKRIRREEFSKVSIENFEKIFNGFVVYLRDLGYDEKTISFQKAQMDYYTQYSWIRYIQDGKEHFQKIQEQLMKMQYALNYPDICTYMNFYVKELKNLQIKLENVVEIMGDIRSEELLAKAMLEAENNVTLEDIQREIYETVQLQADEEYQNLIEQIEKIRLEDGFRKEKKIRIRRIREKMRKIEREYGIENELIEKIDIRDSYEVLQEALDEFEN